MLCTGDLPGSTGCAGVLPGSTGCAGVLLGSTGCAGVLPGSTGCAGVLPGSTGCAGVLPGSTGCAGILPSSIACACHTFFRNNYTTVPTMKLPRQWSVKKSYIICDFIYLTWRKTSHQHSPFSGLLGPKDGIARTIFIVRS